MHVLPFRKLQRRQISDLSPAEETIIVAVRDYFHHRRADSVTQTLSPLLGAAAATASGQLVAALDCFISGYRSARRVAEWYAVVNGNDAGPRRH